MDRLALMKRRTQLEKQRDAELRLCRAKWRSRINSIDRLLRTADKADDIAPQTKPSQASRAGASAPAREGKVNGDRKEGVMEVVRQTLQQNRGFFTARTLVGFINKSQPCAVTERGISHPLWALRKLGEIRLVETGSGRKPHTYLKL